MSKNKTKLALERHLYAPELNKLYILRNKRTMAILPADGKTNFKTFFKPTNIYKKFAIITFKYNSEWSDKTYSGSFAGYDMLKKCFTNLKAKHNLADEVNINIISKWIAGDRNE